MPLRRATQPGSGCHMPAILRSSPRSPGASGECCRTRSRRRRRGSTGTAGVLTTVESALEQASTDRLVERRARFGSPARAATASTATGRHAATTSSGVGQHLVHRRPVASRDDDQARRLPRIRTACSAAASYACRAWLSRRRANRCWLCPPALVRPWTCRWPTLDSTSRPSPAGRPRPAIAPLGRPAQRRASRRCATRCDAAPRQRRATTGAAPSPASATGVDRRRGGARTGVTPSTASSRSGARPSRRAADVDGWHGRELPTLDLDPRTARDATGCRAELPSRTEDR